MSRQQPIKQIKKVRPFPFEALLEGDDQTSVVVSVLVVNLKGAIIETGAKILRPLETYRLKFTTPVLGDQVIEELRVVRAFDQHKGNSLDHHVHNAELHFTDLSDIGKMRIAKFLKAINAPFYP